LPAIKFVLLRHSVHDVSWDL